MMNRSGLTHIILGLCSLTVSIISYSNNPSPYTVPTIFFSLIIILSGLFLLINLSKKVFLVLVSFLMFIMWFSGFNQIYYNKIDIGLYCLELGLLTLGIIIILKFETLKIFNNFQNGLEYYNSIVERSPNNTIFLNNKGVQLTVKRKYGKAISYFDKVLEIDYNNHAALKNKKALIKKMEHNTLSDYLEDYPKLEVIEKKGILFLEIKSK